MLKMFKRISAIVLSLLLVFSFQMFSLVAHAVGVGTEENPYWIETADELQNINEDVTAHYVLKADIDLGNVDFTPIGNATSGAFSGSFDGNGFTIYNLNVFSGKYAGLFGCNEGTVKNVTLSDIFVYGTRYVGGVVGHNTSLGTLENCTVLGGDVESDGGLNDVNVGGICGYNEGVIQGSFSNGASITVSCSLIVPNVGGIIGYNCNSISFTSSNYGEIDVDLSQKYNSSASLNVAGIIGYSNKSVVLNNSSNYAEISASINNSRSGIYDDIFIGGVIGFSTGTTINNSENTEYISCKIISSGGTFRTISLGGLIGYESKIANMFGCFNTGDLYFNEWGTVGGLLGSGCSNIFDSYNMGNIIASNDAGGLIGSLSGESSTIKNCFNNGNVTSNGNAGGGLIGVTYTSCDVAILNCYNNGRIYGDDSGGIVGEVSHNSSEQKAKAISNCFNSGCITGANCGGLIGFDSRTTIVNSFNTGNVFSTALGYAFSGGMVSRGSSYSTIINSYNSGNVSSLGAYGDRLIGDGANTTILNSYANKEMMCYFRAANNRVISSRGTLLSATQMNDENNYISWDFTDIWKMGGNINSGFPILKECSSPLQLDIANKTMMVGETLQLTAYKNGVITSDVEWSVSYGSAVVNNTGNVTASAQGMATITATDSEGNKANCNIFVMTPNTSVSLNDFSVNKGNSYSQTISFGVSGSGDFITEATSSDPSVLDINNFGGTNIHGTAHEPGTATINFKTYQGFTGSCTATVTNYATGIDINNGSFSLNVNRGETKQISVSTTPTGNTSAITWASSNPAIATVDQNGNVTGLAIGNTTITAKTDSGYSDDCIVYVYAPVKSLSFTESAITLEQGQTYQTSIIKDPVDTTDSIWYESQSSSIASVNNNTGLITASSSYTGKTTITATASSGVKAYLEVTVIEKKVNPTEITLNYNDKTMILGDDFDLIPTLSPSNASADIAYSTDDKNVATVDENGNVKAVGEGTTIIRVNTSNGLSTYCVVTVYGFTKVNGVEYFDIYALEDFIIFRDFVNKSADNSSTNARLMVDLDLSSVCSEELSSFTPIGSVDSPYNGTFDGNGHTIKNLYIDSTTYSGLFGYLGADGKVSNLVLDNANVTGTNYVGGIAGKSEGCIEKSTVSGAISGTSYVGGIVGSNTGAINYCGNTADLTATSIVGGISGDSSSTATINSSYSACEIIASDYRQGGLAGINYGAISNSYYDNTLYTGSVVGRGNSNNCENSAKPSTAFESGEVTYLLNADLEDTVFYQTLGTDSYPILNNKHSQVYFGFENCNSGKEIYTNSVVYPDKPNHNFVDDVCTICGVRNTTIVIREQTFIEGLIYGSHSVEWLESELKNMDEIAADDIYIEVYDNYDMPLQSHHKVGTACKVYVYDSSTDELINMYTAVLYGDVNCDGIIDELDKEIIQDIALRTDEQEPIGNWKWFLMAADTNHDGAIDGFDVIETELQTLDMHIIEQVNNSVYISKEDEDTEENVA